MQAKARSKLKLLQPVRCLRNHLQCSRGVEAFMRLQDDAVANAQTAYNSLGQLYTVLKAHRLGGSYQLGKLTERLSSLGLDLRHPNPRKAIRDRFFSHVIHASVNSILHAIKHSARIPIPNSYKLVGVVDEGPAHVNDDGVDPSEVYTLEKGTVFSMFCIELNQK